jgi:hypothetical protein
MSGKGLGQEQSLTRAAGWDALRDPEVVARLFFDFIRTPDGQAMFLGAVEFFRRMDEALKRGPDCPAYEALLCGIGVEPKQARWMSLFIKRKGPELATDLNAARRLSAVVRRITKSVENVPIRARLAREIAMAWANSAEARRLLEIGLSSSRAHLSVWDFEGLVHRAENQDPEACRELGRVAQEIAPFMLDPRGRPISDETATHALLLAALEEYGHPQSFTRDAISGAFVDRATRATRAAMDNLRFDPRKAVKVWATYGAEFGGKRRTERRARRR